MSRLPTPNPKPPSGRGLYPVGGQVREHVSRLGVGLLTPALLPGFRASWAPLPRSFRPCWRGSHRGLLTGPGICPGPLVCCCRLGLALFLHSQVLSGDAEGWMVCGYMWLPLRAGMGWVVQFHLVRGVSGMFCLAMSVSSRPDWNDTEGA